MTAPAARQPADTTLRVPQGVDWAGVSIPVYDRDGILRNDLHGCEAYGRIRRRPGDGDPLFTWSSSPDTNHDGLITFDGGHVLFGITASQSTGWAWRIARWQIDLTDPSAPTDEQTIRVGQGVIVLDPDLYP